jgi:hypothetical protein
MAGNTGEATTWTWSIVAPPRVEPPIVTITAGPKDETIAVRRSSFAFEADVDGAAFECRLDDAEFASCVSPAEHQGLTDGEHTFRVRAVSPAGDVSETAQRSWRVDTTAPTTTIGDKPARHTGDRSARLTFDADEPVEGFECKLGGDELMPFAPCTSPHVLDALADGDYVFRVRATDRAGNQGEPDVFEWSVDNRAPIATITAGPDGTTGSRDATFTFESDEPGTFQCRRDDNDWNDCESPRQLSDLGLRAHAFRVRAIDRAGNIGEPDSHDWTIVDATPPTVTIGDKPARHTQDRTARFTFDADEPVTRFECKLGGDESIPFGPCESPVALDALADGDYVFRVRATDTAGNQGGADVHEWSVDNRAPLTTIGDKPAKTTSDPDARFTFGADEPVERYECRRDEQADWNACESPRVYEDLPLGAHTFRVRAVDKADNQGGADTYDWTIEAPPPVCATSTVTVEADADSWVSQGSRDRNYGRDNNARVISRSNQNGRTVVRFPLPAIPDGCVVTDARLRLWANTVRTGRTLQAIRLASGWQERGITWANQPATVGNPSEVASSANWVAFDVTPQTKNQYTDGNHGFLVRDKVEDNGGAEQVFFTRERQTNRPRLVITFGPPA